MRMQSTSFLASVLTLLAVSACAVTPGQETSDQSAEALGSTNHPGPNYIIEKATFDQGNPKVLDGAATKGAGATLETWDTTSFPPGQQWTISTSGELRSAGNQALCLDVTGARFVPGARVETWTCNGQANQKWFIEADQTNGPQFGVIRPVGHPDLCIDVTHASTANHAPLELWKCNGQSNQRWALFSSG